MKIDHSQKIRIRGRRMWFAWFILLFAMALMIRNFYDVAGYMIAMTMTYLILKTEAEWWKQDIDILKHLRHLLVQDIEKYKLLQNPDEHMIAAFKQAGYTVNTENSTLVEIPDHPKIIKAKELAAIGKSEVRRTGLELLLPWISKDGGMKKPED